ncbi:unnamed protein product, partial [Polarella glacialis]
MGPGRTLVPSGQPSLRLALQRGLCRAPPPLARLPNIVHAAPGSSGRSVATLAALANRTRPNRAKGAPEFTAEATLKSAQRLGRFRATRTFSTQMSIGPTPVWDQTGGPAIHRSTGSAAPRLEAGKLHRVIWMCWTGNNPMPAHLQLCMQTVRRNSGLPVILVTPQNVSEYVPDPHPAYEFLHLAHRADYLRCYLLHNYGGVYLDVDTICLRSLAELFDVVEGGQIDAVGYDGSQWGEFVGISDMGPFRPGSELTQLWFNALHGKLHERLPEIRAQRTDVFYWQEILRDIFVPCSLMHKERISASLMAYNPEQETLWSVLPTERVVDGQFH